MGLEILNADNILFVPASEKSHRLLIVFSAANSRNFTFYNSCAGLQTNMLFIRDPHFNHWFQNGFIKNRTIDDSILFLRELCSEYDYISTFGSSMGGYAALLFGEKLNADRIIAIGPQTTLNHSYSRSPRSNVVLRYPNLSCLEPYCPKSRILIFVGMLDGVDLLNSIKIDNATGMDFFYIYDGDHFLPKSLANSGHLRGLLEFASDPSIIEPNLSALHYFNRLPFSTEIRELSVMTTELLHDKKDFHKVRSIINPYLFDPELPPSIMYSYAAAAFRDGLFGVCYKHLRPIALKFPRCVEFNMLAAEAALRCGKVDFAKACAKRVLSVRSNNRRARDIFEDAIIALGLAADVSIAVGLPALEE